MTRAVSQHCQKTHSRANNTFEYWQYFHKATLKIQRKQYGVVKCAVQAKVNLCTPEVAQRKRIFRTIKGYRKNSRTKKGNRTLEKARMARELVVGLLLLVLFTPHQRLAQ